MFVVELFMNFPPKHVQYYSYRLANPITRLCSCSLETLVTFNVIGLAL